MNIELKESLKYALRSRPLIWKEIRHVEWLYGLSDDELYEYKQRLFLHIFRVAYRHTSFYKSLYSNLGIAEGDIKSLADIKMLPIIDKENIKQSSPSMLAVPRWTVSKADTSGTTGTPLTAYHSYKAIRLEQAFNWHRRKERGFTYGKDKQVSLRGDLGVKKLSTYVPISRTLYLSSYQISHETAGVYYDAIVDFGPVSIEGYPSSLYNLALALAAKGLTLSIPKAFTSSETLFPFQRELIERIFATELFDRYGCTERSVSFSERVDHKGYYEDPGYCLTEIYADHLVTTSLINSAFPLIRYRVEDVLQTDSHGRVLAVEGRNEDIVLCKDGTQIGRLDHILKGVSGIMLAQIVQKVLGEIEIRYVPDTEFTSDTLLQLEKRLYSKVSKTNLYVKLIEIGQDEIVYSSRNKFSFVKSYLRKVV